MSRYWIVLLLSIVSFRFAYGQIFRHVPAVEPVDTTARPDAVLPDSLLVGERSYEEITEFLPPFYISGDMSAVTFSPLVFHSHVNRKYVGIDKDSLNLPCKFTLGEIPRSGREMIRAEYKNPGWLDEAMTRTSVSRELAYSLMTGPSHQVDYVYALLPVPPKLQKARPNFSPDVFTLLPGANAFNVKQKMTRYKEIHWLHHLDMSFQFSQAYISPNWYQGGNNSITALGSFVWNVNINPVYHPNLLVESALQYKLGLFSTPEDEYHKYLISEDNLQWNARAGIRAFKKKWFYSLSLQLKTPLFHNYEQNGPARTASFLSPADLNVGLGLTYSTKNASGTMAFQASFAPVSYNLKTCVDSKVDCTQFGIDKGQKSKSEIGSNAEVTLKWNITSNIIYSSRLFLFSKYTGFTGDWENTVSFRINRFLSTQIYLHARYDTSQEVTTRKWRHWMLKEILSFGFAYNFDTNPKKQK